MAAKREHILSLNGTALCGHPWGWRDNACSRCVKAHERIEHDLAESVELLRQAVVGARYPTGGWHGEPGWKRSVGRLLKRYAEGE
jgi:hypothetical protein